MATVLVAGAVVVTAVVAAALLWVAPPWHALEAVALQALQRAKHSTFRLLEVLLWDVYFRWYWGNHSEAAVCAQLTRVEEAFWHTHRLECHERLQDQFRGFVTAVGTVVVIVLCLQCARTLCACSRAAAGTCAGMCTSMCARRARGARGDGNQESMRISPRTTRFLLRLFERFTPRRQRPALPAQPVAAQPHPSILET